MVVTAGGAEGLLPALVGRRGRWGSEQRCDVMDVIRRAQEAAAEPRRRLPPPADTLLILLPLLSGRWLSEGGQLREAPAAPVSRASADQKGLNLLPWRCEEERKRAHRLAYSWVSGRMISF